MSGLEVIGGVSAVIGIIDTSIKIYNSARKDLKLSEAFKTVGQRLPIILDTLQTCKVHLDPNQTSLSVDICEALEKTLDRCKDKARKVREIFEEVIPAENDAWEKRYLKIIKRLGKGNKVEELMMSITEDVQLVVNNHAVKSASPEQINKLEDIVNEMKSVKSSVPDEESSGMNFDSSGGNMENYINQRDGNIVVNRAQVHTQNFVSYKHKTDFSFRRALGFCLGQAPYIDRSLFVGRGSEIDTMVNILRPGDACREQRRLVLGGIGGIGKTQLAIAYARSHHIFYKSVCWLNAGSEVSLKESFRSIAGLIFDLQEPGVLDDEQIHVQVRRWLSDIDNVQWLLIFDNYDDPTQFPIETYYPLASHGTIIITTRRPDCVAGFDLRIGPLQNKIDDGLKILQSRSRRENVASDPHAKLLATRLAGLPLALATAGAYLHQNFLTFERYLQEYEKRFDVDPDQPLRLHEYRDRTLYTTWDISYSQLQKEDKNAAKLLRSLAYFDNQNLWYELFSAGLSPDSSEWLHEMIADDLSFTRVMRRLTDYCFIEVQVATKSWSMHNCIHDWTLAILNTDLDDRQLCYAFDCVAMSIKKDDWNSFGHFRYNRLAAHATRLVRVGFRGGNSMSGILRSRLDSASFIAQLLASQMKLEAAEQMYRHVLAGKEQVLGLAHRSTLRTVNNLGNLYIDQGKLALAEDCYLQALAGYEQTLGPARRSTLDVANNLGILYNDQGKLTLAEKYYLRALVGREKALGPAHTSTLDTVNNLGNLYDDQGKLALAERYYLRALVGRENALGPVHTSTLDSIHCLGILYNHQGKLTLAEKYYQRALVGYEQALGPAHTSTLDTVNNLGILYSDQSKLTLAEEYYLRALIGREKALGPAHTSTLDTVNNLGNLYRDQGKLAPAEEMCRRALTGYERSMGPEHTSTLDAVNNLGNLYADQGKLALAEEMYQRALAGYEKISLSKTIPALNTIYNLGLLFRDQDNAEEARAMFHRALSGRQEVLGLDHSLTLQVASCLEELRLGKEVEEKQV